MVHAVQLVQRVKNVELSTVYGVPVLVQASGTSGTESAREVSVLSRVRESWALDHGLRSIYVVSLRLRTQ